MLTLGIDSCQMGSWGEGRDIAINSQLVKSVIAPVKRSTLKLGSASKESTGLERSTENSISTPISQLLDPEWCSLPAINCSNSASPCRLARSGSREIHS